jgi:hypothetical protein
LSGADKIIIAETHKTAKSWYLRPDLTNTFDGLIVNYMSKTLGSGFLAVGWINQDVGSPSGLI